MAYVRYVASESVMPGHVAAVTYEFDLQLTRAEPATEILKAMQRSMSGVKETLYFGRKRVWQVTVFPMPEIEAPLMREFLDSTADGQIFTFDPYGFSGRDVLPMSVDREDNGHSEPRVIRTGDPQYQDCLEFAFSVSERL